MKNKAKIYLGAALLAFSSCTDFLDPYPYGNFPEEEFWKNQGAVQGLVNQCYSYMKKDYNNNEGYFLDGATDDAVLTNTMEAMTKLATGALTTSADPFKAFWTDDYKAIALVNKFLENRNGFNARFRVDARQDSLVRYRLQGEAYALRAWFQWDLLKRYGGLGINGEMLGFPIITQRIDVYKDELNWERNSYAECVEQIERDCDSAFAYLPIAHRDYLMEKPTDKGSAGSMYWGCMDGITTKAIKAMMYLTYASPLFNPENDMTRWEKAARYAKDVMDFKLTVDNVTNGFSPTKRVDWTDPNFSGIVYSSRFNAANDAMERALYPAGFLGNGVLGASQELVDAFPMENGYPKDHPEGAKLYDANNPYVKRDPRFYSIIFYNGANINRDNDAKKPMYTFESWAKDENGEAGKDMAGNAKTSRTNYHVKKYIFMGLNWGDASVKKGNHSKYYIRWAHMVLAFAEAANELEGPNGNRFGLSAKEAMAYLRKRPTYDNKALYASSDPYLNEVAGKGKDAFREFIRNERRVETCFEGMRFYDLRRWSEINKLDLLNKPVSRPVITKTGENTYTYDYEVVENRIYSTPFIPVPYDDILRMDKLVQNKGWEKWQ